jgi:glycosyltransferase involved in cell wall biosynthesis
MTRVSVVIPAYNSARFVGRAIGSVLSQTFSDLEVIVVDDGSQDATSEVVEAFVRGDPRVQLLRMDINRGPSHARNVAVTRARGEWIALLDADDWFDPVRLEVLLEVADQTGADFISDDICIYDEGIGAFDGPMFGDASPLPPTMSCETFIGGNLPNPARPRAGMGFLKPLMRSDFLRRNKMQYDPEMRFAEDYKFYLQALIAGAKWHTVSAPYYMYVVRSSSLTATHGISDLAQLCDVDRLLMKQPSVESDIALMRMLRRHLISSEERLYWAVFSASIRRGKLKSAAQCLTFSMPVTSYIVLSCALWAAGKVTRPMARALKWRKGTERGLPSSH